MNTFLEVLASTTLIQILSFAALLLTGTQKSKHHKALAALLIVNAGYLVYFLLIENMVNTPLFRLAAGTARVSGFLFGPALYYYALTIIKRNIRITKRDCLHLVPAAVRLIFTLIVSFYDFTGLNSLAPMIFFFKKINIILIFSYAGAFSVLTYTFSSINKLYKYQHSIKNIYSDLTAIKLTWLNVTLLFIALMQSLDLSGLIIYTVLRSETIITSMFNAFSLLINLSFINYLYVKGIRQPGYFAAEIDEETAPSEAAGVPGNQETAHEDLPHEERVDEEELRYLLDFMREKKPYLKEDITLPELARQMGIPRNRLSFLINQGAGENFFTFINRYRVEEVKLMMADPEKSQFTILALAFDAGFRSKSAFNNTFKKLTGKTPLEYRGLESVAEA